MDPTLAQRDDPPPAGMDPTLAQRDDPPPAGEERLPPLPLPTRAQRLSDDDVGKPGQGSPFVFVSYTAADELWAAWVASVLEGAELSARVQVWDAPPGMDFAEWMNVQLANARWTVALYSKAYFTSAWCAREWTTALIRKTLLPVRIEAVDPPAVLATLKWVDVFDIDEDQARDRLLHAVGVQVLPRLATFPGGPRM